MIPTLLAAALLMVAGFLQWQAIMLPIWFWFMSALFIVGLAWLCGECWIHRPTRLMAEHIYALAHNTESSIERFDGELGALQRALDEMIVATRHDSIELADEKNRRQRAEAVMRESDERYSLSLRCISDGLWEWDLKSDRVHYSPAWKAALGYGEDAIGDTLREWHDRIHPDDRHVVLQQLNAHLAGECAAFECDHRLRHRDGSYRWFLARGRVVRNASGAPYKVIGLNTDIATRKRAEEILYGIANGLAQTRGNDFFHAIVKNFAQTLCVQYAFITQCVDRPPTRVRMIAAWKDDAYDQLLEYDLLGTPCDITIRQNQMTLIPFDVATQYPAEAGYQSYLGIPICDSTGEVLGHLACLDAKPMDAGIPTLPIFTLFALRAGIEMERQNLLQQLAHSSTPA